MRLDKIIPCTLAVGALLVSPLVIAAPHAVESHWAGLQLGLADIDVDGGDLDVAESYQIELGRWFNSNFGVEMGITALRDAKEEGEDNRGTYELNLETNETYVGPRLSTSHYDTVRFYVSGGLLYSRVKIEVKEEFFGLKPGGTASDAEESLGYYVGGGMSIALPGRVDLTSSLRYRQRMDAMGTYAGDIDINDMSFNIGAAYRF